MQLPRKYILGLLLCAVSVSANSVEVQSKAEDVTIKLDHLEMIHPQEKHGDELYFSISEFPEGELPSHYQIPHYPAHWLSKYLSNVKNVVLWNKTLGACKNVDVIISLVEEDFAPWDLDDELGSVKFKITCDQGKIKTGWSIPNGKDTGKLLPNENAFSFTGKKSEYHAIFTIEETASLSDPKSVKNKEKMIIEERRHDINLKIPMAF